MAKIRIVPCALTRALLPLLLLTGAFSVTPLHAQERAASSAAEEASAQIPVWGDAGDKKLQSSDLAGALEDYAKAYDASRDLKRQYPQEPSYSDNTYYYLTRLALVHGMANDFDAALQMAEPAARGYAEMAAINPTADYKERAASACSQLSWYQTLSNNGPGAEVSAQKALGFSPDFYSAKLNLAHAMLLNGKRAEAEAAYRALRSTKTPDGRSLHAIILEDFDAMEKAGAGGASVGELRKALGGAKARKGAPQQSAGSNWLFWVLMVLVGLITAALIGGFLCLDRKRTAQLEKAAQVLGYTFRGKATPEDLQLTVGSQLTNMGRNRTIRNIIEVPESDGSRLTLFEFSYVTGGGRTRRTYQQTVARFEAAKLNLPAFDLRPEGLMSKLVQGLGFKDIDLEGWPKFSKMFQLRGEDESAIRRLFNAPFVQYCEGEKRAWMSGAGNHFWFHRENHRAKPDQIGSYVTAARQAFAILPSERTAASTPAHRHRFRHRFRHLRCRRILRSPHELLLRAQQSAAGSSPAGAAASASSQWSDHTRTLVATNGGTEWKQYRTLAPSPADTSSDTAPALPVPPPAAPTPILPPAGLPLPSLPQSSPGARPLAAATGPRRSTRSLSSSAGSCWRGPRSF